MPKPQRWCACFDLHGDCQDESAVRVFHRFVKYWKPTIKVMGGDLVDMRWLRGRASEGEKRERPLVDFCTRIHDDLMEVLGNAVVYPYDKRKGVWRGYSIPTPLR